MILQILWMLLPFWFAYVLVGDSTAKRWQDALPKGLYVGCAYAAIATDGRHAKIYGSRGAMRSGISGMSARGTSSMASMISAVSRCFLQNVIGVVQRLFQISVGRRGKAVFLGRGTQLPPG
jgi:hypothetical protein